MITNGVKEQYHPPWTRGTITSFEYEEPKEDWLMMIESWNNERTGYTYPNCAVGPTVKADRKSVESYWSKYFISNSTYRSLFMSKSKYEENISLYNDWQKALNIHGVLPLHTHLL